MILVALFTLLVHAATIMKMTYRKVLIVLLFDCIHIASFSQILPMQSPHPQQFQPMNNGYPSSGGNNQKPEVQRANQQIQHYEQEQKRREQNKNQVEELYRELHEADNNGINYSFPSLAQKPGAAYYRGAFDSITAMLKGDAPVNVQKAIFLTENAYLGNSLKYSSYHNAIKAIASVCKQAMHENGYSATDNLAKIMVLYQYFCDTLVYTDIKSKTKAKHYPFTYDFDDYEGIKDYTKLFTSKVLSKGSGQCHSLPLLFLACCQELGVKTYLSFSPNHSFIRFKDKNGKLRNMELTNGRITTDAWILGSGYIKGEAIKSKIYLDTLDERKVLAECLYDLALGYTVKYGYDIFVLQVVDTALQYHPANVNAAKVRANYYTLLFNYIAEQYGKPTLQQLLRDSRAKAVYDKRNQVYDWLDNNGYTDMPAQAYEQWLNSVNEQKQKQDDKALRNELNKSLNLMEEK